MTPSRTAILASVVALALPAAGAAAESPAPSSAGAATTAASSSASVRIVRCGSSGGAPSAAFEGRMRAVPGTHHMRMRFVVQEKVGPTEWRMVEAPALRKWRRASSGVGAFSFTQKIENLRLEGAYRMRVLFRWHDRADGVLRASRLESPACPAAEPFPGG